MKKTKKIFLSLIIVACCIVLGVQLRANADATKNASGWLWGGSEDCDMDKNGWKDVLCGGNNTSTPLDAVTNNVIQGNEVGLGWISMNDSNPTAGGTVSYGVDILATDGPLSGQAWSSNLGWIDFAPAPDMVRYPGCGFPAVSPLQCFPAKRTGNNLEGWARFLDIKTEFEKMPLSNSGGWEGWISLKGTAIDGSPYGVDVTKMDGTGANPTYAWSNDLGYIDFSGASINVVTPDILKVCGASCDSGASPLTAMTISVGDSTNLKACYNTSVNCSDSLGTADVTNSALWDDNNPPNIVTKISDGVYRGDNSGTEQITATYSGQSQNVDISVTGATVDCWKCNTGTGNCASTPKAVCDADEFENDESGCNTVCEKPGGYIEVNP